MQDGNTFPRLPKRTIELPPRQFVSFPATGPLGLVTRLWLWWLRAYLNRERYRLQVYGRAPKTPQDRGSAGRVKLTRAKRWGLYLDDKFQTEFDNYHREIGEHEAARFYRNEHQRLQDRADTLQRELTGQVAATQELVDDLRRKADNLKANVGELVSLAAERAETITRIQERLDIRTEVLRLLRVELNGKYIPWGDGTCQDMADIFEANGYGHIEPPQPGVTNQPPVASDTLNAHREGSKS